MIGTGPVSWLAWPSLLVFLTLAHPQLAQSQDAISQVAAAETSSVATPVSGDDLDEPDSYRLTLLKLKGHLGVARALLQRREPGADHHLQQPFEMLFRTIEPELKERGAPLTADVLAQLDRATETDPRAALTLLDGAASAIDGSFAQPGPLSPRSALGLAEALLREAVDLYGLSVVDNEVVDLRRYQAGRGYVIQAEALVRHSTGLRGQPGHEALLASVVLIRQAWPSVIPPPIVFDPAGVAARMQETAAAMETLR